MRLQRLWHRIIHGASIMERYRSRRQVKLEFIQRRLLINKKIYDDPNLERWRKTRLETSFNQWLFDLWWFRAELLIGHNFDKNNYLKIYGNPKE